MPKLTDLTLLSGGAASDMHKRDPSESCLILPHPSEQDESESAYATMRHIPLSRAFRNTSVCDGAGYPTLALQPRRLTIR